jgi:hypothetical protein
MSVEYRFVVADGTTELGEVDTYESAEIVARHNDISTWEMVLPAGTEAATLLTASTRPRLVLWASGEILRSGPVTRMERSVDVDGDVLTVSGVDDMIWLRRRLAHPQPGTPAPPYSASAYDTRTGPASQVAAAFVDANAGPGAVTARRVPGLTVPVPAAAGPSITVRARYQNLFDLVTRIARSHSLTVEVSDLVLSVTAPAPARVYFSVGLGTLAGWTSEVEAPEVNYLYVAGAGVGTARLIREYPDADSVGQWQRIEGFDDRRDTSDTAELDQAAAETLADAVIPSTVSLVTVDTPSQSFLEDWRLGDMAVATVGGVEVTEVIAEVHLLFEANAPPQVTPVLGGPAVDLRMWRQLNRQSRQIRQLERM